VKRRIQKLIKLRSSALLVAMSVGIVLSGLVVGVALTTGEYFKLSGQSREGKVAYRAALSGIDDGLLRYKYASAEAKTSDLYNVKDEEITLINGDSSYKLSFVFDSIRVGSGTLFSPGGSRSGLWNDRSVASLKRLIQFGAKVANVDDVIDIDLSYFARLSQENDKIDKLYIYFTNPFIGTPDSPVFLPARYFTALNYQLTDLTDVSTGGEDSQLIGEGTNDARDAWFIQVSDINQCMQSSKSCHLRIKPYAASLNSFAQTNSVTQRLDGVTEAQFATGKKIAYAIEARDRLENLLPESEYSPGTLIISSVGRAGQATRKIQAKIDLSSGKYLGLFDYGVFCGSSCGGLEGASQSE
jgi:hypothetical protein